VSFITEDGTGLLNANSMVTVVEFDEYFTDRGNTDMTSLTLEEKQSLLVKGADYLNLSYVWENEKLSPEQSMPFPRTVFGLPQAIKRANIILASKANDDDLIADAERRVKKEKVSSLEIVYDENDTSNGTTFTEVELLVKPYTKVNSYDSDIFHRVTRA